MGQTTIGTLDTLDLPPLQPRVRVKKHRPDTMQLGEQVRRRLMAMTSVPYCLYVNPLATVSCREPTPEFFKEVRRRQAQWCKQSRTLFGQDARRSAKHWGSDRGWLTKQERFLERALCFTGALFINGKLMPPHRWRDYLTS